MPAEWQCQAETVASSAVPSAGRGSSPGPARLPSRVLSRCCRLCSAAASAASVLGSVGLLPHSTTPLLRRRAKNMMANILNIRSIHPIASRGEQRHATPSRSRVEGGLTGVFRNQRKISFYFIQFLRYKVAQMAQRSILLPRVHPNIKGLRPGGLRPKKVCFNTHTHAHTRVL